MSGCYCEDFEPCCCAARLGPISWRAALDELLRDEVVLASGADALARLLGRTSPTERAQIAARHESAVELWPLRQMHNAVDRVIERLGDQPTAEALLEELVAEYGSRPLPTRWAMTTGTLAGTLHQRAYHDGELEDLTSRERAEWDDWMREIRGWSMPAPGAEQDVTAIAAE